MTVIKIQCDHPCAACVERERARVASLPDLRRRIRGWVTYQIAAEPEDQDPADHFSDERDVAFARSGDLWAWCSVTVRAEAFGLYGEDFLGGCSYHSERDFTRTYPDQPLTWSYYGDMCGAALDELTDWISRSGEARAELAESEHMCGAPLWGAVLDADDEDRERAKRSPKGDA